MTYRYYAKEVHFDTKVLYHPANRIQTLEERVNNNRKRDRGQIVSVYDDRNDLYLNFTVKGGVFKVNV